MNYVLSRCETRTTPNQTELFANQV
jgi:hypothetical protein